MVKTISKKILRDFGITFAVIFPLFIGFIIPKITGNYFKEWTLLIGFTFLILAIFKPMLLLKPYKIWIALGNILGFINSHIILGLVFLIIFQPIAFLMKLTGYDPLRTKRKFLVSYREVVKSSKIDLKRIF